MKPHILAWAAILAVIVAVIVAIIAWTWRAQSADVNLPQFIALAAKDQDARLADTQPGVVRIVRMLAAVEPGEEPDPTAAPAIVEVNHLGPLTTDEARALQSSCERYLDMCRRKFEDRNTNATDSGELLAESMMLYDMTLAETAIEAVERGSYFVLSQSEPMQLTLPRAEVLSTGTRKDGQPVNISIVMPLDAYPRLREVRDYLNVSQMFDDSEKARKFNSLPDIEREALAARIREIRMKEAPTREERAFLEETLGFNTKMREGSNILYAFPVR